MEKLLFLDDERMPIDCTNYMRKRGVDCSIYHKEWNIVRSYKQFCDWIVQNGLPDIISYDHDISDISSLKASLPFGDWFNAETNKEYTGMDCAHFVVAYCMDHNLPLPKYIVHSANPCGVENIEGLFKSFKKHNSK